MIEYLDTRYSIFDMDYDSQYMIEKEYKCINKLKYYILAVNKFNQQNELFKLFKSMNLLTFTKKTIIIYWIYAPPFSGH